MKAARTTVTAAFFIPVMAIAFPETREQEAT
jgi:hypothetical protein